jgi:DNA polymerase III epsilon subunit-like protein
MRQLVTGANTLVGHNIIRFDLPVLERLVGAKPTGTIIDTLPLSWYLFPQHIRHGLDDWGKRLGIAKPTIEDWDSLTYEEYKHRCEEDVKINAKLWQDLDRKLDLIYRDTNKDRLINYMTFKMQCAADQEAYGWKLDVAKAEALLEEITRLKDEKEEQLRKAMPKTPITTVKNKPKQMYRKDGTLSTRGEAWEQLLRDKFLPASTSTPVTIVTGYEDGNPNSHEQVKDWLFSLGWKPQTFKYVKGEEFGEERKIPQVRDGSELCESVRSLSSRDPAIELLDGLSVLTHRLGVVRGFVESHENGWLKAEVAGLTNTFRFKHMKPLVNLPAVDKPWGKEIRGCLTAPDGHTLCGSDMVSLEDTTKRHYMQPLDPDYVAEMSREGFDPHLSLSVYAGAITQEEYDFYVANS